MTKFSLNRHWHTVNIVPQDRPDLNSVCGRVAKEIVNFAYNVNTEIISTVSPLKVAVVDEVYFNLPLMLVKKER